MSATDTDPIGFVIAERYEVLGRLGSGKHGEVWHVRDANMDMECAIKLLDPAQVGGPWEEAQLLNTLSGDFVLPIRNADTTPEGTRYLVTDLARHGTVEDKIDPVIGMPEEQAVTWIREACNGLARVHRHGLLHRDIKPENLFLTEGGHCLVGDLSLAGKRDESGYVGAGGTLQTMAPEVGAVGCPGYIGDVAVYDVRSEVFSLGATLYWALTGAPPTDGTNYCDAARSVPEDIWELAPHISRGTRDITMKCLSRKPDDRYDSPAALAAALGSRRKPQRRWIRVTAHLDHERCFEGSKAGGSIGICVIRRSPRSGFVLEVRHIASGRRHKTSGETTSTAGLNRAIRSSIRAIG